MKNDYYIRQANVVVDEADKMLQAVKRCLTESKMFPIYLTDLQNLVDNLMYLNVAHNAVNFKEEKIYITKKKISRNRK